MIAWLIFAGVVLLFAILAVAPVIIGTKEE
jgi:hypothetical protein